MNNQNSVDIDGIRFHKINNDVNSNPRYVFHFLNIASNYFVAKVAVKKIGGRAYRGKWYGGGLVISSYNLNDTVKWIKELRLEIIKSKS